MFYIVRLTDGSCAVVTAADDALAREHATTFIRNKAVQVATVRPLDHFALQLSPTEDGCLEVTRWEDATLDGILSHEYPLLKEACERANSEPLVPSRDSGQPAMWQLRSAFERNSEIIREALEEELHRPSDPKTSPKSKATGGSS